MASTIDNLTDLADQVSQLQLPDGSVATLELIYQGTTERWCAIVTYGTFTTGLIGLCCYPNVLRQWDRILPFGIACVTADQTDPVNINDFASGRVILALLTQSDIAPLETAVFGGPQV